MPLLLLLLSTAAAAPPLQIMEMARMTPGQRLELLKEVGGTRVYEERRRESVKIMAETEARRTQVRRRGGAALRRRSARLQALIMLQAKLK